MIVTILCVPLSLLAMLLVLRLRQTRLELRRLRALAAAEEQTDVRQQYEQQVSIELLQSELGRAGMLTRAEQRCAACAALLFVAGSAGLAAAAVGAAGGRWYTGMGAGAAGGAVICAVLLNRRRAAYQRELQFHLPLVLETLILAVDSGLSILPAIAELPGALDERRVQPAGQVERIFGLVYRLSAQGVPFTDAARRVAAAAEHPGLRHALLHLDLSASEGGELIPSLRSLSCHAHVEWRLSVEARIRRLETAVVFPVFLSVLGLLLLVSAVPILPILELAGGSLDEARGGLPAAAAAAGGG